MGAFVVRLGDGATAPSSTALVVVGVAAGVIALATAGFAAAIRPAHTGGEAESAA